MTLTVENIPAELDAALRRKAQSEGKSVSQVALEMLRAGAGLSAQSPKRRDLSDLAGSWAEDPEFDKIMREQDQIDPEMWR
jgi:plasmid stability protein